jgi:hypothetical protein
MDAQANCQHAKPDCPQYSAGIWRKTGFLSNFRDFPPDFSGKFGRKMHACSDGCLLTILSLSQTPQMIF